MTTVRPPAIGAHLRVSRGLARHGIPHAERIGATAVQVFTSNPRGWARSAGDHAQEHAFATWAAEHAVEVFVHAPYLVNLASPAAETVARSVAALRHGLDRGRVLGARGVVFHAGSLVTAGRQAAGLAQISAHLRPLLDALAGEDPDLLVEPTAGGGFPLAAHVTDLEAYLAAVGGHPRLKVCLDTCHLHAAGHDLAAPGGLAKTLDSLLDAVGPDRLALVHANDSKDPAGSRRDRHEAIGAGTIGREPFAGLFTHPAAAGVPVVVETPSEDDGAGHAADIATLRTLADRNTTWSS
ncbi:MAG TPA: deoxyribonuclease IV [Cryptosporangiaceae bacterium]|nr:deoxyribonuclease IV [Cryptosporangiaceae bacterium]